MNHEHCHRHVRAPLRLRKDAGFPDARIAADRAFTKLCVRPHAARDSAMIMLVDDELEFALRDRWTTEVDRIGAGSTWVDESLQPVLAAAAAHPDLRRLFPFTSMNRLCFSRCSEYPYTFDCPCIAAGRGQYAVLATWAVGDEPAPVLAETDDPTEAVSVMVKHLPADRRVWIGTSK